ncbi:MAG: hypothetical protein HY064_00185 [Bacteroidetes bacterium]|nr:hypothetical protein [Bacteroidota bacterium]
MTLPGFHTYHFYSKAIGTICFTVLLFFTSLDAQRDTCAIKLRSVQADYGFNIYAVPNLNIEEQQSITPGSSLLRQNFGTYSYHLSGTDFFSAHVFSAGTEFNFYNRKKNKYGERFSAGMNFSYENFSPGDYGSFIKTTGGRSDTTYSTVYDGMGNPHPDTIVHDTLSQYFRRFAWKESICTIGIHVSFHTEENQILSAGTGLGIQFGLGLAGKTDIYSSVSPWTFDSSIVTRSHTLHDDGSTVSITSESFKTKPNIMMSAIIPLYLQLRFPEKWDLLHRFAFTIAVHQGLYFITIPGVSTHIFSQPGASAGLKFYFE